jgi:hypothetical protein
MTDANHRATEGTENAQSFFLGDPKNLRVASVFFVSPWLTAVIRPRA